MDLHLASFIMVKIDNAKYLQIQKVIPQPIL